LLTAKKISVFSTANVPVKKFRSFFRPGICLAGRGGAPAPCTHSPDCAREGVAGNPLSDNKFGKSVIIREFAVK